MRLHGVILLLALCVLARKVGVARPETAAEQIEFFETKIRPIFAENCYQCHSAKAEKVQGGLRIDAPEELLKGGGSGPALVPGDPDASLLIKAVRYSDPELQMPPKNKKLSAEQIASLEAWVKMGAPLPHSSNASAPSLRDVAEARARHWAFQPVTKPSLPVVKQSRWVRTPVDNFVLATLEKNHLQPAPAADRRSLIRRVSYDLTGLPPSCEEVEAFVGDKRTDAYAKLVDRLLASPHYGERWGRYWLDVARYADTKGYLAGGEERRYAFSFTYRDYVVRAFNEDKPYDQFITEQIAADVASSNRSSLAAMGFLTLGRRFLNNQNDIIDDRIDVVTRGTLGLTVACARCHDHKFDPISAKDYYALHGVFASSDEPPENPLLGPLRDSPEYQDYLKQKAKIEAEIEGFKAGEIAKFKGELRQHVGDYLLAARDAAKLEDKSKFEDFAGERKVNPIVLRRWIKDLEARGKKLDAVFAPWFELARLAEGEFASQGRSIIAKLNSDEGKANPMVAKALAGATNSLKGVAEAYTKLFQQVDEEWKAVLAKTNVPAATALSDGAHEAVRQVLYADGAPPNLPKAEAEEIMERRLREGSAPFRNRIEALSWTHPGAPPRAMALAESGSPHNSHVLTRGNPSTPGEEAPRRFLEVLSGLHTVPLTNGSGRLDLARAITDPKNPLTARVYANRVWLHHFGEALVSTPGDFGVRTAEPLYRPLLDYMAAYLLENGWSTKSLHRLILLSATYQQSSDAQPGSVKADPENRYLSRMNRQRLDFEAMRDTLLAVAGILDLTVGGLPVELEKEPFSTRRTIYALIDRQNLPGLYRTFDFANPDTSSQVRFRTTVPQQALFLLNSPFVLEQARNLAGRAEAGCAGDHTKELERLYRLALQRLPTSAEAELAGKFMAAQSTIPGATKGFSPLAKYAQILLLSNELIFVD